MEYRTQGQFIGDEQLPRVMQWIPGSQLHTPSLYLAYSAPIDEFTCRMLESVYKLQAGACRVGFRALDSPPRGIPGLYTVLCTPSPTVMCLGSAVSDNLAPP